MRKDKVWYEQYKTQFQIWQTTKKYSLIQPALRRVVDRMYLFRDLYGQYHCTQGNSTKAYFAQESFGAEKGLHLPPWGRLPALQIQRPLCPSQLSTLGPQRPPPALAAPSASTSSASRMDASPPSKASPQVGEWATPTKKVQGSEQRGESWREAREQPKELARHWGVASGHLQKVGKWFLTNPVIEEEGYCMHEGCRRPLAVTSKIHLLWPVQTTSADHTILYSVQTV